MGIEERNMETVHLVYSLSLTSNWPAVGEYKGLKAQQFYRTEDYVTKKFPGLESEKGSCFVTKYVFMVSAIKHIFWQCQLFADRTVCAYSAKHNKK